MSKSYQAAHKAADEASPWSPFWAAVRQAAEELRQARATGQHQKVSVEN